MTFITVALLILTVVGLGIFRSQTQRYKASGIEDYQTYSRHFVFIGNDSDSRVSESLYQQLREYGLQNDCYVERAGDNLAAEYTKQEQMDIAIRSDVSGIILEGDNSEETVRLVNKAYESGIPVVTVMADVPDSKRVSFVGMNNYSAGTKYGKLIVSISERVKEECKTLVLMNSEGNSNENTLYAAIQETLKPTGIQIESAVIDSASPLSAEEKIADVLDKYESLPDIIVCLSDINTRCAYQYIVNKNAVGNTTIIGFYDSPSILRAIDRGTLEATFSVDTEKVAVYCVDALNEYIDKGNVSEYFSTDYIFMDKKNVKQYLADESGEGTKNETN